MGECEIRSWSVSSSKGSLNGIRPTRVHAAAPAERRGETVDQESGRPAPTAYRRLHLHRTREETTAGGGEDRRPAHQVSRIDHPPMTVKEKWNGLAKLPLALESRKVKDRSKREHSVLPTPRSLSGICHGRRRPFVGPGPVLGSRTPWLRTVSAPFASQRRSPSCSSPRQPASSSTGRTRPLPPSPPKSRSPRARSPSASRTTTFLTWLSP